MRLPRDLSGRDLAKGLAALGYIVTRETGDHMRLTTCVRSEHHVTIPHHHSLRIGTLHAILAQVAVHFGMGYEELEERVFGQA